MRAIMIPLALAASLSLPLAAQSARFIKVDIVSKTVMQHHAKHKNADGPTEVHIRMPISLAKGVLDMVGEGEIKVNGESKKGMKPDQLQKLLSDSKPGDLLLEITTDKGDHVRVTVE
ncbi:MAG: hypothetical protein IPP58_03340 [Holophagaceae bacterium]|uniref:Uncharacterized protein n=1 Tax=Candidatus Geothrix skivensis TaxID=2954439 RepID=A0A9D7SFF3_9BACT|nr:hypothetical protein [Candidatus Geothrix skivensis]